MSRRPGTGPRGRVRRLALAALLFAGIIGPGAGRASPAAEFRALRSHVQPSVAAGTAVGLVAPAAFAPGLRLRGGDRADFAGAQWSRAGARPVRLLGDAARLSAAIRHQGDALFQDPGDAVGGIGLSAAILLLLFAAVAGLATWYIIRDSRTRTRAAADLDRLLDAVDHVSDGLALYDAGERLVVSNTSYQNLFGGAPEHLVPGSTLADLVDDFASQHVGSASRPGPEWVAECLAHFRAAGAIFEVELNDGRWYRFSSRRTKDDGLVVSHSDITEVKRRESALADSEARYRGLIEHLPHAVLLHADEIIVFANAVAARLLGAATPEALIGRHFLTIVPPYRHATALEAMRSVEREGRMYPAREGQWQRLDGGIIDIEVFAMPFPYKGRRVAQLIAQDISERRRAEDALRLTQISIDRASEGLLWIDPDGNILYANDAACRIYGYSRDEFKTVKVFDIAPNVTDAVWQDRWEMLKRRRSIRIETEHRANGNRPLPVEITVDYIEYRDKQFHFVSVRDVTRRRNTERELLAAKDQAEAASRAKSEFLANVSHELRTPLNAIIGFSEIMRGQLFGSLGNPRYAEYAADIHDSGTHLLDLINDILDVSRAEAGELTPAQQEVDLAGCIQSSMRLIADRARSGRLTLEVRLPPALPALRADERMVKQMLINLLTNAVKFTPEGGRISVDVTLRPDGGVDTAVADTGIGIAPTQIPIALMPFRQIENSFTRKHGGTGLGLPLVKSLIELHGGAIEIISAEGAGTRVTLHFPAERAMAPGSAGNRLAAGGN